MAGSGHTSSDIWEGVGQGVCLSPLLGLVRVCVRACVCVCACVCELLSHVRLFATDPMDCSLPGSPIHGILQARVLEWVAISFCVLQTLLYIIIIN